MNIYCLDISSENIFLVDIEMDTNFEVVAASLKEFNDSLYNSFADYLDSNITTNEFLSDVEKEFDAIPTHIIANKSHISEYENSDELIVIGPHSNPSYFFNIDMCRHVF